jgi:membrane protein
MVIESALQERGRGRRAEAPRDIPARGWKDILRRTKDEIVADRVTMIAAGATFYLLLALFPALAAFVSIYGFVADPVTIADHIAFLGTFLPRGGVELIGEQLKRLTQQPPESLSIGFIGGLLFALWSANNGIKTLFEAMNVAYDESEKRGFIKLNLITLGITFGALVLGVVMISAVGIVPAILGLLNLGQATEILISLLRWPVLLIVVFAAIVFLYRFGPSRERAQWRWLSWGSAATTVIWMITSILFSAYLTNIADYNATYGSLGALIGFMMWTWISVTILIAGAELNAEMEHQTARDTTTGEERPMGARGAVMADTLGKTAEQPNPGEGHAYSARSDVPAEEDARKKPALSSRSSHRTPADRKASPFKITMALAALGLMRMLGFGQRHAKHRRPVSG